MKISGILVLLFFYVASHAQSIEERFDTGNRMYQEGKFAEAAESYEAILKQGYAGDALFFNLGNAYYKMGRISEAILQYERARKTNPTDEELRHNLKLANLLIADRIEPAPRLFVWDWWDEVKDAFSLTGVTWFGYFMYVGTFAFLSMFVVAPSHAWRRISFMSGVLASVLFFAAALLFVGKLSDATSEDEAIIMTEVIPVKNSPDGGSTDAFVLHGGVKVQITETVGSWIKIKLADGKVGWVPTSEVTVI